jgi:hypothetical protein
MDFTEDMAAVGAFKAPAKPKGKKRPKPKKKAKAKKRKAVKAKKSARKHSAVAERTERLDMRLTKAQKAKIHAKAKKTRRTVTSIVYEAIEKIR